jgi:hypothetical protein
MSCWSALASAEYIARVAPIGTTDWNAPLTNWIERGRASTA